jgi:hypothetical protein
MDRMILTKDVIEWLDYELSTPMSKRLRKDFEEAKKAWIAGTPIKKRYNSTHNTPLIGSKIPYSTKN